PGVRHGGRQCHSRRYAGRDPERPEGRRELPRPPECSHRTVRGSPSGRGGFNARPPAFRCKEGSRQDVVGEVEEDGRLSTLELGLRDPKAELSKPILSAVDLAFAYGNLQVLFGVSIDVYPGEALALLG